MVGGLGDNIWRYHRFNLWGHCTVKKSKNLIRKQVLQQRRALESNTKKFLDKKICEKALRLIKTIPGNSVFCYESFEGEVATKEIILKLQHLNYHISTPRIKKQDEMVAVAFSKESFDSSRSPLLRKTSVGELETKKIEIVLVPLIAFSKKNGMRIGYGCGFYDKWFEKNPEPIKIGLAYSLQQRDDIIPEDHDIALDFVVSELELFDFKNHRLYPTT